jgi:hypothetical protein
MDVLLGELNEFCLLTAAQVLFFVFRFLGLINQHDLKFVGHSCPRRMFEQVHSRSRYFTIPWNDHNYLAAVPPKSATTLTGSIGIQPLFYRDLGPDILAG